MWGEWDLFDVWFPTEFGFHGRLVYQGQSRSGFHGRHVYQGQSRSGFHGRQVCQGQSRSGFHGRQVYQGQSRSGFHGRQVYQGQYRSGFHGRQVCQGHLVLVSMDVRCIKGSLVRRFRWGSRCSRHRRDRVAGTPRCRMAWSQKNNLQTKWDKCVSSWLKFAVARFQPRLVYFFWKKKTFV